MLHRYDLPPLSDDEWRTIHDRQLLSEDERRAVLEYEGFKPFLLVVWALAQVDKALANSP